MELGGILRARDLQSNTTTSPPVSHRLFSKVTFMFGKSFGGIDMLREDEQDEGLDRVYGEDDQIGCAPRKHEEHNGGWLEGDEIEDF